MTELEREQVIAEREEARTRARQRAALLALDDADAAADAAPARRSGREVREESAKKSAMEELREARRRKAEGGKAHDLAGHAAGAAGEDEAEEAEEGEAGARGARAGRRAGRRAGGAFSSDDEEGGGGGAEEEEEYEEAPFEEVRTIQVRRHRLAEWVGQPFFEAALPGAVVRLATRPAARGDPPRYILAQVAAVEPRPPGRHKLVDRDVVASPYAFPAEVKGEAGAVVAPGGPLTPLWLRVARGAAEHLFPLVKVSDGAVTEEEFASWHRAREGAGLPQLGLGEVRAARARLERAAGFRYSAADVAALLAEKRAAGAAPANAALERARLERARDAAREAGDAAGAAAAAAALAGLEAARAARAAAAAARGGASMAALNRRNADVNFQTTFRAAGADATGGGGGGGGGAGGEATLDPFSRRATRSVIYWKTGRSGGGGAEAGEGAEEGGAEEGAGAAAAAGAAGAAAGAAAAAAGGAAALAALDLSALEAPPRLPPLVRALLGGGASPAALLAAAAGAAPQPGARVLSLAEYRRLRGRT
jgi:RNA polymerase-associated protein RTF1